MTEVPTPYYAGPPRTVDEAVERVLAKLSDSEKESISIMDEGELHQLHFSLGIWIRNNFGLWQGNKELLRSCGSEDMHEDDASAIIIKAVWKRLKDQLWKSIKQAMELADDEVG